jgi:hypothetical protein
MSAVQVQAIMTALAPDVVLPSSIGSLILLATSTTGNFGTEMIGTLGTKTDYAIALRTLHMVTRVGGTGDGSMGGIVTLEREGQLSREYAVNLADSSRFGDLVATTWGRQLIELIKGTFFLPTNRMMPTQ